VLTPRRAYAYDSGPEHFSLNFSNFNGIDPKSQPDLSITSLSASAGEGYPGDVVSVSFTIANTSRRFGGSATAASNATTAAIYLWSDAAMTQQVGGPLSPATTIAAMAPDAPAQTVTQSIALPSGIPLDQQYYLGVRSESSAPLAESDLSNNSRSTPLILKDHAIALNLASTEKLPGGRQHFFVQSGAAGPYLWSVNGIDGGSTTFGIVSTNTDYAADYTAPAAVPDPRTSRPRAREARTPRCSCTGAMVPSARATRDSTIHDSSAALRSSLR
jgi:hypothetical protein